MVFFCMCDLFFPVSFLFWSFKPPYINSGVSSFKKKNVACKEGNSTYLRRFGHVPLSFFLAMSRPCGSGHLWYLYKRGVICFGFINKKAKLKKKHSGILGTVPVLILNVEKLLSRIPAACPLPMCIRQYMLLITCKLLFSFIVP